MTFLQLAVRLGADRDAPTTRSYAPRPRRSAHQPPRSTSRSRGSTDAQRPAAARRRRWPSRRSRCGSWVAIAPSPARSGQARRYRQLVGVGEELAARAQQRALARPHRRSSAPLQPFHARFDREAFFGGVPCCPAISRNLLRAETRHRSLTRDAMRQRRPSPPCRACPTTLSHGVGACRCRRPTIARCEPSAARVSAPCPVFRRRPHPRSGWAPATVASAPRACPSCAASAPKRLFQLLGRRRIPGAASHARIEQLVDPGSAADRTIHDRALRGCGSPPSTSRRRGLSKHRTASTTPNAEQRPRLGPGPRPRKLNPGADRQVQRLGDLADLALFQDEIARRLPGDGLRVPRARRCSGLRHRQRRVRARACAPVPTRTSRKSALAAAPFPRPQDRR